MADVFHQWSEELHSVDETRHSIAREHHYRSFTDDTEGNWVTG